MKKVLNVIISIIFILTIVFLFEYDFSLPKELRAKEVAKPIVTVQSSETLYMNVKQMVDDGETLYILYHDYGVVQAYDLDGNYLYTISMYNHQSGGFRMAVEGNTLYVFDKNDNLYAFQDGEFIRCWLNSDEAVDHVRDRTDFDMESDDFEVRFGSIYDISSDEAKCIIERPVWVVVFNILSIPFMPVLIIMGVLWIGFKFLNYKYNSGKKNNV